MLKARPYTPLAKLSAKLWNENRTNRFDLKPT
jgi:hypothetical protein